MDKNTQIEAFEKAFYNDGYQLGMKAADAGLYHKQLFTSVGSMYDAVDGLIESFKTMAEQQNQNIACQKGCEWCCHQPVFALDYELDYLREFLQKNADKTTQKEIAARARKKNNKLSNLQDDELLNSKYPCPLLKNGCCLTYAARPMACRIYLSSNLKTCLHFFQSPDDKNNYPALLDLPMRLGRMMNEGFKTALKFGGHEAQEFRIEERL
jgi:Fe-S-cluster containining protein